VFGTCSHVLPNNLPSFYGDVCKLNAAVPIEDERYVPPIEDVPLLPGALPLNLRYAYQPTSNKMEFYWTNPARSFDEVRLEYHEVGSLRLASVNLDKARESFTTYQLHPGIEYMVRVYVLADGQRSEAAEITFTIPNVTYRLSRPFVQSHVEGDDLNDIN
jgi:hypothetical protein